MSMGEVSVRLDGVKDKINKAPYGAVAEGLRGLTIVGLDGVQAGIQELIDALPANQGVAAAIKKTADDGAKEAAAATAGTNNEWITAAAGSMGFMGEKVDDIGVGLEYDKTNLEEALGHLAALKACLDQHQEIIEIAQENLVESQAAGATAIDQITRYQAEVAVGQ
ncbi:MAG TPA: hypothetical protein VMR45_03025 [Patescibacteria group bacterium]|nr:hypothetical protein [Patescibacteria group bacterium]